MLEAQDPFADASPEQALLKLIDDRSAAMLTLYASRPSWDWATLNTPTPLFSRLLAATGWQPEDATVRPFWRFPVTPADPWLAPPGLYPPPPSLRLAGLLVAHDHLDPWAMDAQGQDLWDQAVQGGHLPLIDQLWRHPRRPAPETLWARGLVVARAVAQQHGSVAHLLRTYGAPLLGTDPTLPVLAELPKGPLDPWLSQGWVPEDALTVERLRAHWRHRRDTTHGDQARSVVGLLRELELAHPEPIAPERQAAWNDSAQAWLNQKNGRTIGLDAVSTIKQPLEADGEGLWVLSSRAWVRVDQGPLQGQWPWLATLAWGALQAKYDPALAEQVSRLWYTYDPSAQAQVGAARMQPDLPARGLLALVYDSREALKTLVEAQTPEGWLALWQDAWAVTERCQASRVSPRMAQRLGMAWCEPLAIVATHGSPAAEAPRKATTQASALLLSWYASGLVQWHEPSLEAMTYGALEQLLREPQWLEDDTWVARCVQLCAHPEVPAPVYAEARRPHQEAYARRKALAFALGMHIAAGRMEAPIPPAPLGLTPQTPGLTERYRDALAFRPQLIEARALAQAIQTEPQAEGPRKPRL